MLGGLLWVESEVGKGSCFHFIFSAQLAVNTPMVTGLPHTIATEVLDEAAIGLRILLAEDNPVNQKIAVRMLEKQGHSVAAVGTGTGVLELFTRERFDLILMDVQMPEMDGIEATAAIRQSEKISGQQTPIIALTAHAMIGDRERCLAAGMNGYTSKPVRMDALNKEIKRLQVGKAESLSLSSLCAHPDHLQHVRAVIGHEEIRAVPR